MPEVFHSRLLLQFERRNLLERIRPRRFGIDCDKMFVRLYVNQNPTSTFRESLESRFDLTLFQVIAAGFLIGRFLINKSTWLAYIYNCLHS